MVLFPVVYLSDLIQFNLTCNWKMCKRPRTLGNQSVINKNWALKRESGLTEWKNASEWMDDGWSAFYWAAAASGFFLPYFIQVFALMMGIFSMANSNAGNQYYIPLPLSHIIQLRVVIEMHRIIKMGEYVYWKWSFLFLIVVPSAGSTNSFEERWRWQRFPIISWLRRYSISTTEK